MKKIIAISIMSLLGFLFCATSFGLPAYKYVDGAFHPFDASAAALSSRSLGKAIPPPAVVKVKVNGRWVWAANIGKWESASATEAGSNKPITDALARIRTANVTVLVVNTTYYVIPGSSEAWDSSIKSRDLVGIAKMVDPASFGGSAIE